MRYVLDAKPVTSDHETLGKLSVQVEHPVFEDMVDFVEKGCAGSEQRAVEWINGHAKTDSKNEARLELRDAEPSKEDLVNKEGFINKLYASARAIAKSWSAEVTIRRGGGQKSKASLADAIASEIATGKALTPAKFAELAAQFGVKVS